MRYALLLALSAAALAPPGEFGSGSGDSLTSVARAAAAPGDEAAARDARAAELAQAREEAAAKARADGEAASKARTKAILSSEHAQGREKLANHLAFETDMPADQAVALLQNAERAKPDGSRLDAAMTDPKVDPAAQSGTAENPAGAALASAVDRMVSGMKPAS